nr:MAG TPA: hypothetical protein [Bacteriophage sp.]DAU26469.1 MAG TPA: hypothetical protein [Caudoviricetes sp.]
MRPVDAQYEIGLFLCPSICLNIKYLANSYTKLTAVFSIFGPFGNTNRFVWRL